MLKNLTRLESIVQGKVSHLYLDNDTPLTVVKDMLLEYLTFVGNLEADIKKQQAAMQPPIPEESVQVEEVAVEQTQVTLEQPQEV